MESKAAYAAYAAELRSKWASNPMNKKIRDNLAKTRHNDEKEEPGSCCFCKKRFETLAKFLRHVSHSKLCLNAHDPDIIHHLKEKSRKKSKRKWYHKKKTIPVIASKTNQFKGKTWRSSNAMKNSDRGKAFYALLTNVFEDSERMVRLKLQKLSKVESIAGVNSFAFDESMDAVFNGFVFNVFGVHINEELNSALRSSDIATLNQYENETFLLEEAFKRMEKWFVKEYEQKKISVAENWIAGIFSDMSDDLFQYTWNHSLSHFYNHHKLVEATNIAQDNALDKIFNSLIFDEQFEHFFSEDIKDNWQSYCLEEKLASVYVNTLKEEFKTISDENGFSAMVVSFVEEKWIRKFRKFGLKYFDNN